MDKISPEYYRKHPSGVECIDITRYYCFDIGNAITYLWRAGLTQDQGYTSIDKEIENLNEAVWYIKDRIKQLNVEKATRDALDKFDKLLNDPSEGSGIYVNSEYSNEKEAKENN